MENVYEKQLFKKIMKVFLKSKKKKINEMKLVDQKIKLLLTYWPFKKKIILLIFIFQNFSLNYYIIF